MYHKIILSALLVLLLQGCQRPVLQGTDGPHNAPVPVESSPPVHIDPAVGQPITRIEPGTDISEIRSDGFALRGATLHGDVLELRVGYRGGTSEHSFELYWAGISTRTNPPQLPMILKHNRHHETGNVSVSDVIYFDISSLPRPFELRIVTDHGGNVTITSE